MGVPGLWEEMVAQEDAQLLDMIHLLLLLQSLGVLGGVELFHIVVASLQQFVSQCLLQFGAVAPQPLI